MSALLLGGAREGVRIGDADLTRKIRERRAAILKGGKPSPGTKRDRRLRENKTEKDTTNPPVQRKPGSGTVPFRQ